jgi:hypothetical protein
MLPNQLNLIPEKYLLFYLLDQDKLVSNRFDFGIANSLEIFD